MSVAVRRAQAADVAALASLRWTWRGDEVGEQPAGSGEQYLDSMREWWTTHPDHAAVLAEESDAGTGVGMAWLAMGDRVPSPRNRTFAYRMPRHAGHGTGLSVHQVGKGGNGWLGGGGKAGIGWLGGGG